MRFSIRDHSEIFSKKALKGIEAVSEALDTYNRDVEQAIPWEKLKEIAFKLGQFESKLFSKESTDWILNIKTELLSALDTYDTATLSIYEGTVTFYYLGT